MSSISIKWDRRALKEVKALAKDQRQRIYAAVQTLRDDPLRGKALVGPWKGLRRLRVGSYRIIYGFDGRELLISVVRVGRRDQIYRK